MSYLTDLRAGTLSPIAFFKKSTGWLARQAGLSDNKVDELVKDGEAAIDRHATEIEASLNLMLAAAFPALPETARQVVAQRATMAAIQAADLGIGAAGAMIKSVN
jgi:hypothetical protein